MNDKIYVLITTLGMAVMTRFSVASPCVYIPLSPGNHVSSRSDTKIWIVEQNTLKVLGELKLPAGEGHQIAVVK